MDPVHELSRCAVNSLSQDVDPRRAQGSPYLERCFPQGAVRGEQRHQMAVQGLRHVQDHLGSASGVVGAATRIRQVVRNQEQGVAPIVERAVNQQLVAIVGEPQALAQEPEVAVRRKGRAGQHHRFFLLEQHLGQDGTDGQRGRVQHDVAPHHVDPLDLLIIEPSEDRSQTFVELGHRVDGAQQLVALAVVGEIEYPLVDQPPHIVQPIDAVGHERCEGLPLAGGGAPFRGLADRNFERHRLTIVVPPGVGLIDVRDRSPQLLPRLQGLVATGRRVGESIPGAPEVLVVGRLVGNSGQVPEQPVDAVQLLREVILGDFKAELPARLLLQVVGFVDDEVLVILQHGAAHGQIGQQQGVVHHQDVRRFSTLPGLTQETGRPAAE